MTKLSASFWFTWLDEAAPPLRDRNYYAQIKKFLLPKAAFRIWFIGGIGLNLFNGSSIKAQVTSDNTLGTQVNTADNISEISGGTQAGGNLFHSFQDFSIETGGTAFFNNGADISNIVGRITGGNISSIDGLIRANGNANLILINPSGINFGANASLDIGGSFLGSTADSLIFEDGTVFSATDAQVEPMLSINVPIGLQLGQKSSAPITVEGMGHNLSLAKQIFSPFTIGEASGLEVPSGQTLALVGGKLNINGGTLTAKAGRIELGSIESGIVNLNSVSQGWRLSYDETTSFQNITFSQKALADVSGVNSGSIQVQGKQVSLNDGSAILIQNQGNGASGDLTVNASESLEINGTTVNGELSTGVFTETLGNGKGGKLEISTQQLSVLDGGVIVSNTFGDAEAGQVVIDAAQSIQVQGFSAFNPSRLSFISTSSFGKGDAGDLNLSTRRLTILDGSRIGAGTFGSGSGGNISVEASLIEVIGAEPSQSVASLLGASSLGVGSAGDLTIDTARLVVQDGGRIDSSAAATGSAGNVNIQAAESIEISGIIPGTLTPSLISSGANIEDELAQRILGLPSVPSGDAGSVNIETGVLKITDNARVSVVNEGLGDAGILEVEADSILLNNQGSLSAATQTGVGGNITLQADNVFLQANSTATATAAGAGNGGNISIDADNLAILGDSQLVADAVAGMGGSVEIDTQGFFQCQECQITASSRLGIDGQVNIETLQPLSQLEVVDVFQQPTQAGEDVAIGCPAQGQPNTSKLAVSGRGGLPPRPQEALVSESLIRFDNLNSQAESPSSTSKKAKLPAPARGWYLNSQGTVVLAAQLSGIETNNKIFNNLNCRDR